MQGCAGVPQDGLIGPMTRKMQYVTEDCLYRARNTTYNNIVRANIKMGKIY
jgi:hypothetical protein